MDVGDRRLSEQILSAFYAAHRAVGFGMPEQICASALGVELTRRHIPFKREVWIEVVHLGVPIGHFRVDFIVCDQVVLETKSAESIRQGDELQLLNYLRVTQYELGFVLLFGIKARFRRLVYSNSYKRR